MTIKSSLLQQYDINNLTDISSGKSRKDMSIIFTHVNTLRMLAHLIAALDLKASYL